MASIEAVQRKGYMTYRVRWREPAPGRESRRRFFRDRSDAEQFAENVAGRLREAATRKPRDGNGARRARKSRTPEPMEQRIWRRCVIDTTTGCLLWQGRVMPKEGYGVMSCLSNGRYAPKLVHRLSYETFVGPIPAGLHIDHLCRVRNCVNPNHLEPVTSRQNTLRSPIAQAAIHARKTHCINGHEFTDDNTARSKKGDRICRACCRERAARANAKRRGMAS